ncbi:MAG: polynucleotide kinase [Anaerolineae bacterium]|nr:polynucleotide kinase [Anaerolineae bacterium]
MSAETKDEIVIFDIDGTLADISARQHHLLKKPKDWEAFFQGMARDKPIAPMLRLCNTLYEAGFQIILCSGRPEKYREETETWLSRYGVKCHALLLRPSNDRRSDVVIKREMLHTIERSRIAFIVEDRSRVVNMWREEGFICLQCAPGEF